MKTDVLILGAGMVGISAALALQQRGRSVILADRRGAAEETSYGNAGLIQREGVVPYSFPRDIAKIISVALGSATDASVHYRALPQIAPFIYGYWRNGGEERVAKTAAAAKPLVERSIDEHEAFMQAAGISHMLRRTGYLKIFRDEHALQTELKKCELARERYGVAYQPQTERELLTLEPHLNGTFAGAILMPQPASVADPELVGKSYADLFVSRGGQFVTADAHMLQQTQDGWRLHRVEGDIESRDVVIALGPWSRDIVRDLGVDIPMGVKRGYHMHYNTMGNATLERPVLSVENGFVLTTMNRGIRLTTGAEFATRDAASTPRQLRMLEPIAKQLFPLRDRLDDKPWRGARPCFPDMLPMIGSVPGHKGLWLNTGHHHLGFTLGPVSGRLIAEMITGAEPFTDPSPYRVDRF